MLRVLFVGVLSRALAVFGSQCLSSSSSSSAVRFKMKGFQHKGCN